MSASFLVNGLFFNVHPSVYYCSPRAKKQAFLETRREKIRITEPMHSLLCSRHGEFPQRRSYEIKRYTGYVSLLFLLMPDVLAGAFIMHSSDGGENWCREESNTISNLNDVAVSLVNKVFIAVGDQGTILRRGENGIWADVSPEGLSSDLYSVAVGISGMMACGEDGILLSSFDGGNSWKVLSDFGHGDTDLYSVNFDPSHSVFFLITGENGFIYSSERRGVVLTGSSSDFVASCVMLCSGFPELALGRDGSGYNIRDEVMFNFGDAAIRGATEIVSGGGRYIAVGDSGYICRNTSDHTWESVPSGTEKNLNDVSYLVWGVTACAVGDNGTVLMSRDNGVTWEKVNTDTRRDLTAVAGNGAGVACIVGKSALSGLPDILPFRGVSH